MVPGNKAAYAFLPASCTYQVHFEMSFQKCCRGWKLIGCFSCKTMMWGDILCADILLRHSLRMQYYGSKILHTIECAQSILCTCFCKKGTSCQELLHILNCPLGKQFVPLARVGLTLYGNIVRLLEMPGSADSCEAFWRCQRSFSPK